MGGTRNRERPCRAASSVPALPTPPIAASGRQPPLTRGRRPLAAKGSSERAESRCLRTRVPMGGTRNRERPCRAASSVPHSPRHQLPPQGASHLLHAAGALSRQKGRASGQSRDVCAPACRWAAHATERGPVTPPVAFRTPHATNCRLRAPATSYTRPAPSRGKRVERAGRVAMSLRTWVFAAYMLYPVPRRTRFDNQNLPQNLRPPLEIC